MEYSLYLHKLHCTYITSVTQNFFYREINRIFHDATTRYRYAQRSCALECIDEQHDPFLTSFPLSALHIQQPEFIFSRPLINFDSLYLCSRFVGIIEMAGREIDVIGIESYV